ncbi:MAG: succinate dehydrogenase cytochrome b subunit [Bacteroidales bacterium]|nr:succinate dehydrogenase cytochrome b subunit [Bacteroidales bacterium]
MFLNSSVGKKIVVSVSGLFLALFLVVHLFLNFLTVVDDSGDAFVEACNFMERNFIIKIMEYVLAAGFIFHIFYTTYLTWKNRSTRTTNYHVSQKTEVSWSSQNMWISGFVILGFLILHLYNYWYKFKFDESLEVEPIGKFYLVVQLFHQWYYTLFYIIWFIALGLHLNHSIQSGLHTLGLTNQKWIDRLNLISSLYAIFITVGFSIISLYHYLTYVLNNY